MKRRDFNVSMAVGIVGASTLATSCSSPNQDKPKVKAKESFQVTPALSKEMYDKALEITKKKVRGGDEEPFFKAPFVDAAFSDNIFLWDTCFIVCFAKYHLDELPVYQALDNFYDRMESDGFICREYRIDGRALWPKDHPVSINPPLLALAETEIYSINQDKERLKKVYPILKKNFEFHIRMYQGEDKLFWGDTLGLGMDNIPRFPRGWTTDEGNGMTHHELGDKLAQMSGSTAEEKLNIFIAEYVDTLQGVWNSQSRLVDFTSQMAMFALQLKFIAQEIGETADIPSYDAFHKELKTALNEKCWDDTDGFYYDLGYDKQGQTEAHWHVLGLTRRIGSVRPDGYFFESPD